MDHNAVDDESDVHFGCVYYATAMAMMKRWMMMRAVVASREWSSKQAVRIHGMARVRSHID